LIILGMGDTAEATEKGKRNNLTLGVRKKKKSHRKKRGALTKGR